jgi:hypothetical protein
MNVSAGAAWRSSGQPLFYAGAYFYRAGATVFFDGRVMRPAGADSGVVFYSDVTQEPFSLVYVPIGGGLMQPYERMRDGELAGTVGSRTPSFPIDFDVELPDELQLARAQDGADSRLAGRQSMNRPSFRRASSRPGSSRDGRTTPVPSAGSAGTEFTAVGAVMIVPPNREGRSTARELGNGSLPTASPDGTTSVWVEFEDARWFSAGAAVLLDSNTFDRVGDLNGFPVYRERGAASARIYVTVTRGGLVAPYQRR